MRVYIVKTIYNIEVLFPHVIPIFTLLFDPLHKQIKSCLYMMQKFDYKIKKGAKISEEDELVGKREDKTEVHI